MMQLQAFNTPKEDFHDLLMYALLIHCSDCMHTSLTYVCYIHPLIINTIILRCMVNTQKLYT
jgi:hypothetical protein